MSFYESDSLTRFHRWSHHASMDLEHCVTLGCPVESCTPSTISDARAVYGFTKVLEYAPRDGLLAGDAIQLPYAHGGGELRGAQDMLELTVGATAMSPLCDCSIAVSWAASAEPVAAA